MKKLEITNKCRIKKLSYKAADKNCDSYWCCFSHISLRHNIPVFLNLFCNWQLHLQSTVYRYSVIIYSGIKDLMNYIYTRETYLMIRLRIYIKRTMKFLSQKHLHNFHNSLFLTNPLLLKKSYFKYGWHTGWMNLFGEDMLISCMVLRLAHVHLTI